MMTSMRRYRLLALALVCVFVVNIVGCGGGAGPARQASESAPPVRLAATVSPADSAYLGDMDDDGLPSVGDAIKILRIVVNLAADDARADANENGSTDVGDAIKVLRCVVQLDTWPIGVLGGMSLDLSPNGPTPQEIEVVVGGQSVAQPTAQGDVPASPSPDATCTVIAVDTTTQEPLLLAVTPPTGVSSSQPTDGNIPISPQSTIEALIFFRLGGWLLPQDNHADFMALLQGVPEVTAAVQAFESAYNADGHALSDMSSDALLSGAFEDAVNAASVALANSPLMDEIRDALEIAAAGAASVLPQEWTATPTSAEGIDLSISGDTVSATNSKGLYRWAEIRNSSDQRLGWNILPDKKFLFGAGSTVLRPDPLPAQSPLSLMVTGGLKDYDGDIDFEHIVPLGLTASLRIVVPLISCIIGVRQISSFDPLAAGFDVVDDYDTGHSLVDWAMEALVWDPDHPADSLNKPVPRLIKDLAAQALQGEIDVVKTLTDWAWKTLVPALASDLANLAQAVVAQFAGQLVGAAVLQILGAVTVPWLVAIIKGAMIANAILTIAPSVWDLAFTKWEAVFSITGEGGAVVIISSIRESKEAKLCAVTHAY